MHFWHEFGMFNSSKFSFDRVVTKFKVSLYWFVQKKYNDLSRMLICIAADIKMSYVAIRLRKLGAVTMMDKQTDRQRWWQYPLNQYGQGVKLVTMIKHFALQNKIFAVLIMISDNNNYKLLYSRCYTLNISKPNMASTGRPPYLTKTHKSIVHVLMFLRGKLRKHEQKMHASCINKGSDHMHK